MCVEKRQSEGLLSCLLLSLSSLLAWLGSEHAHCIAQYPLRVHGKLIVVVDACIVIVIVLMTTTDTAVCGQRCHHSTRFSSSSLFLLVGENDPGKKKPGDWCQNFATWRQIPQRQRKTRRDRTRTTTTTTRILVSSASSIIGAASVGIESAAAALS